MFEPDSRFFNENGSINLEAATAAGRDARSEALVAGLNTISHMMATMFQGTQRAVVHCYTRLSSSPAVQEETA